MPLDNYVNFGKDIGFYYVPKVSTASMHFSTIIGTFRPSPLESACTCSARSLPNKEGPAKRIKLLADTKKQEIFLYLLEQRSQLYFRVHKASAYDARIAGE